jgi:hypothetical protein
MIAIVSRIPNRPADIAKLIGTPAGHMIAALVLFYNEFAFRALSVVQVALEELHLVGIAITLVAGEEALRAEF